MSGEPGSTSAAGMVAARRMTASAFWCLGGNRGELRHGRLPAAESGMCLVRTLYSAISPGTERVIFTGDVPEALDDDMRVPYMEGSFAFPVKYGYSLVGEVVGGPGERTGRVVHVMHPHQDLCAVRGEDVFPVPQDVPPARATLASNLETAVNAIWDADVRLGDRALVVGFGVIGSLIARLLTLIPGVYVEVAEVHPDKRRMAESLGFLLHASGSPTPDFDTAFHTSGTAEGLQHALDHVGFEGRVAELSWYGTRPVRLHLGDTFHSRRKTIISSQVSAVSRRQRSRWDRARRRRLVFDLLKNPVFDAHISHTVPFQDLPEFFPQLVANPADCLSVLVTFNGDNHVQRNGAA